VTDAGDDHNVMAWETVKAAEMIARCRAHGWHDAAASIAAQIEERWGDPSQPHLLWALTVIGKVLPDPGPPQGTDRQAVEELLRAASAPASPDDVTCHLAHRDQVNRTVDHLAENILKEDAYAAVVHRTRTLPLSVLSDIVEEAAHRAGQAIAYTEETGITTAIDRMYVIFNHHTAQERPLL
jgi:hypothetical protein